jgi:2-oxoisovalerate dehydrogenase E2 component (dihydrolipoyl transacylase)
MVEFALPDVGEGLTEAEVVAWRVQPGDGVAVNDVVVEIETAKSLVELPSPFAGTVAELLVSEGSTVPVGTPLLRITLEPGSDQPGEEGDAAPDREPVLVGYGPRSPRRRRRTAQREQAGTAALHGAFSTGQDVGVRVAPPEPAAPVRAQDRKPSGPPLPAVGDFPHDPPEQPEQPVKRPRAKPPVRRLARDLGIDLAEVGGTGPGGTVTRTDVEAYAQRPPTAQQAGWDGLRRQERVPVRSVRRATAQAVVRSAFTAPHVTQFLTVDATASMQLLTRLRAEPAFAEARLSPLTLAARAMCLAARRTPEVTQAWDDEAGEIVVRRYVDLAVATATPRGLLVPVVRDADRLDLAALGTAIADLAGRAREGRTKPTETSGGTLAVTNIGVFGMDAGTPIIPPGLSAILALGQVARRPWVVQTAGVEAVEPRWVVSLALSFDHRHIDGEQGSRFLTDVGSILDDPARALALA